MKQRLAYPRNYCVYFILCPELNRVKIGYTARNPNQRLESVASMNAGSTIPLGIIPRVPGLETRLHARFKQHRLHHEWFNHDAEIARFVEESAEPWPESWVDHLTVEQQEEIERIVEERRRQEEEAIRAALPKCDPGLPIDEIIRLHEEGHNARAISAAMGRPFWYVRLIVKDFVEANQTNDNSLAITSSKGSPKRDGRYFRPTYIQDPGTDPTPCRECYGLRETPVDGQCPACGGTGLAADT